MGHWAQLHRVWPAGQRGDSSDVRGNAGHASPWPLVGDRREVRGQSLLYTAPTAIRTFMKWGEDIPAGFDLSLPPAARLGRGTDQPRSLDLVPPGHRRRPLSPSSTRGGKPRPARIMISPLPGVTAAKPGSATWPSPGVSADVVDNDGQPVPNGGGDFWCSQSPGRRCCAASGATTSVIGRPTGPGSPNRVTTSRAMAPKKDDDGDLWLLGRVDDVMNVSGHRISTTEVESALVSHERSRRRPSLAPPTQRPDRLLSRLSSCGAAAGHRR